MTTATIRRANEADIDAIAAVHVQAWQETYTGLLPDSVIAGHTLAHRRFIWGKVLTQTVAPTHVYVAEHQGDVAGFGCCGPNREAPAPFKGEFQSIYLLQRLHGLGLGPALLAQMAADLRGRGLEPALVWVLADNRRARAFYEKCGGVEITQRKTRFAADSLVEIAYGWQRLDGIPGLSGAAATL